jgi:hypothetical protein
MTEPKHRALQTLRPSSKGAFEFLPTSLVIHGEPTLADWEAIGDWLSVVKDATQWWLGDWLAYGEGAYPERFAQALDATKFEEGTLKQYEWVCRRVPPHNRRLPSTGMSFSHHREIADLEPDKQDVWLDKAEKGDGGDTWSCERLRKELRKDKLDGTIKYWVLVEAKSPRDAEKLMATFKGEDRRCKVMERAAHISPKEISEGQR